MSTSGDSKSGKSARGGGKRRRTAVVAVIAVLIIGVIAGVMYFRTRASASASPYRTATATLSNVVATVSTDGEVVPVASTDVVAKVSGTVKQVYVELGDTVSAGDKLYELDTAALHSVTLQAKTTLAAQQQSLQQAQASLKNAQQAVTSARAAQLQAEQNLSALESQQATAGLSAQIAVAKLQKEAADQGVSAAKTAVQSAEKGVSVAKLGIESAQYAYDKAVADEASAVVTAPVSGMITTMDLAVGSVVTAGSAGSAGSAAGGAPVVISSNGEYKIQVNVNESQRPRLEVGQEVTVSFDSAAKNIAGTVEWIAPAGTNSSGVVTFEVDIALADQPEGVVQGMSATAKIETDSADDVITVPTAAIKVDGQTTYVIKLSSNGTMKAVVIETGITDNTKTQVLSGVSKGDVVVLGLNSSAGSITLPTPSASAN